LPLTTAFENEDNDEYEYETPNAKRQVSGLLNFYRSFLCVFAPLADIA
jgi:hypothetical protein